MQRSLSLTPLGLIHAWPAFPGTFLCKRARPRALIHAPLKSKDNT